MPLDVIRQRADKYRSHHWDGNFPIDIEKIIEFELNIEIIPEHGLYSTFHTNAYLSVDCKQIRIDFQHYWNPQTRRPMRFSLAHEIGHLVLHSDIIPTIRPTTVEDWKNMRMTIPDKEYDFLELHAYEFAGRFLVPKEKLITEVRRHCDDIKKIYDAYPDIGDDAVISGVANKVCKFFDVSHNVISRRIKFEKIWEEIDD